MTHEATATMTPCADGQRHEREINRLRDTVATQARELAGKETKLTALEHDHKALVERIPEDLAQWTGEVTTTLRSLSRGQEDVVEALRKGYVTVAEFEPVKKAAENAVTRHDLEAFKQQQKEALEPLKKFVYGALLALIGAVASWFLAK